MFLPFILALVFAFQNEIFNIWLKISPGLYQFRLFIVSFSLGILIYIPAIIFRRKGRYIYLFLSSFFVSIILLAQYLNYKYSKSYLQLSALKYASQTESILGTVKSLLSFQLLIFLINIFIVLGFFIYSFRKKYQEFIIPWKEKLIIIFLILGISFLGYNFAIALEKKEWGSDSRLYSDVYDLNALVGKLGIVNFSIEDAIKYFARSTLVSEADKNFLKEWAKKQIPEKTDKKYFGLEKGKNLIFIQVESLENAVINQKIDGQDITPNLNLLANQGMYFSNYYTQIGPGNTADAEFSTLDSLYPLPDDVVFIDYAKNQYNALPHLLTRNGYGTYVMHGDVPTFWNRSNIYPELGYQKTFNKSDYIESRSVGKGPSDLGDEDLFLQSLTKLKALKQPFMATLITISSHTPFILPDDLQTLQIDENSSLSDTQKNYLESVHYTDKAIGEFIDGLKKNGLYDDSLIVIFGDHGSFTGISKALGTNKVNLPGMSASQVPLIILDPTKTLLGTKNIPASHLDIYPTVANLLGIKAPKTVFGQDILNTNAPVEVKFNLDSGAVNTVLTDKLAFQENKDGIFDHGACLQMPEKKSLPVNDCKDLYNNQADKVKISDIVIRGNLLNLFASSLPK
jgi:phosphoglycerol transferase MdoB-like AlkP superfamily enzyme